MAAARRDRALTVVRPADDDGAPPRARAPRSAFACASEFFSRLCISCRRRRARDCRGRRRAAGAAGLRDGVVGAPPEPPFDGERLAADRGLAVLVRAIHHPEPAVRARAISVICEFADERAALLLKPMIHDPSPDVRRAAIRAAARVATTEVVASLIVALADPDVDVRAAAADAVSQATGRSVVLKGTPGAVDAAEIEDVKRWWKDRRYAELLRTVACRRGAASP